MVATRLMRPVFPGVMAEEDSLRLSAGLGGGGFHPLQERRQYLQVSLRLFQVRRVGAVLEDDPLGTGNAAMESPGNGRGPFVIPTAQYQRGHTDLSQPGRVPIPSTRRKIGIDRKPGFTLFPTSLAELPPGLGRYPPRLVLGSIEHVRLAMTLGRRRLATGPEEAGLAPLPPAPALVPAPTAS